MGESQVKFLLIMPKSLIEDVEQASLRLGQSKAAFVRECIRQRLKDISGERTDCQPTAVKEDRIVVGRFEALFKVVVTGLVGLGLVVMSYLTKG